MLQAAKPITQPKRILLAEDSAITQDILKMALGKKGHEIASAQTAQEAIDLLKTQAFDVAFIDFHLPDRNGCELAREFLRTNPQDMIPRMIALTGDAAEVMAYDNSCDYFDMILAKPFMISDLVDVVASPDSIPRPASKSASLMAHQRERPEPLFEAWSAFHIIYFPFDFYGSFKNAVSMSIAKHGAVDAIVLDAVPSDDECEILTKIKGLGTAAHIDRTQKFAMQSDLSVGGSVQEAEIIDLLEKRRARKETIHRSRYLCKTLEDNLLINLYLKNITLKPTVNFSRSFGVLYNHILPAERFDALAQSFVSEGFLSESNALMVHRCPHCQSARLYPKAMDAPPSLEADEVFCTDCQSRFAPADAQMDALMTYDLTPMAKAHLATPSHVEMMT